MKKSIAKEILFGTAVGDALGIHLEFKPRILLSRTPNNDMVSFGATEMKTNTKKSCP